MVAVTWIVPSLVFFITIFGWQYFGRRNIDVGKCYVQYLEEPLFNCLLQVRLSFSLYLSVRLSVCLCLFLFVLVLVCFSVFNSNSGGAFFSGHSVESDRGRAWGIHEQY